MKRKMIVLALIGLFLALALPTKGQQAEARPTSMAPTHAVLIETMVGGNYTYEVELHVAGSPVQYIPVWSGVDRIDTICAISALPFRTGYPC